MASGQLGPPEIRRQVVELARAGTRVKQLAATFGMSEAAIYLWLKQEQIDRGEIEGLSTAQAMELAAAKRRIRQLQTELAGEIVGSTRPRAAPTAPTACGPSFCTAVASMSATTPLS